MNPKSATDMLAGAAPGPVAAPEGAPRGEETNHVDIAGRTRPRWLRLPDPLALLGIAALFGLWYLVAGMLEPVRLPSPTEVAKAIGENFTSSRLMEAQGLGGGGILDQLWITVVRTLIGVAIGGSAGVLIGVAMGTWRRLHALVGPPLETLRLIPTLVAVPFLVLWFGTAAFAQIGLIIVYSLVTMQVSAYSAVRNLPPWYASFAETLGASRWRVLRTVIVPGILPDILGGVLVVLQLGWGLVVVAEIVGAQRGLGRMMSSMQSIFRTEMVVAGLVMVALAAVVIDRLLRLALYRAIRWSEVGDRPGETRRSARLSRRRGQ